MRKVTMRLGPRLLLLEWVGTSILDQRPIALGWVHSYARLAYRQGYFFGKPIYRSTRLRALNNSIDIGRLEEQQKTYTRIACTYRPEQIVDIQNTVSQKENNE
ncbi:uncharacterized protein EV420DRAFT_589438 [Desarmillaria tabescens]|uniref:Uncharacterized protein n=1 Tax=Armillaria tabescens TaxID=1929756 RepID=A0AA39K6H1_ARMTA|nr:uncharacterized protein EV420DRAFT_589438 [Desarmillaria tabescens]KAK0455232.1 hypothetical protein EV420DRAFT_589438 [Desarmillaria tabescens]